MEFENEKGVKVLGRARCKKPPKPKVTTVVYDPSQGEGTAQLQPIAARILMKVLYAARMCRFDLLRAVCALAQRVTKWDGECDRKLHRLMAYVKATLGKRLVGYVGDAADEVQPHLYTDADLAGCGETQRSTSGVFHCLRGPRTSFPVAAISKRQGCVSHSTPEAELVALNHGLRTVAYPALDVWCLFRPKVQLVCHEDNDVAVRICQSGRNPTMRYVGRTHGMCIAWLHEQYMAGGYTLEWTASHQMAADIFTKAFTNPEAWNAACWLVSICDSDEVHSFCLKGGIPPPQPQGGYKSGVWDICLDGSGTWTRHDRNAYRCRTLFKTGPARHEVVKRVTVDAKTGEVLNTLPNFGEAKVLDQELPPPCPREIKTIFHFKATKARVPPEALKKQPTPNNGSGGEAAKAGGVTVKHRRVWQRVDRAGPPFHDRPANRVTWCSGRAKTCGWSLKPRGPVTMSHAPAPNTEAGGSSLRAGGTD